MQKILPIRSILDFARTLWSDTNGIILPYVTVLLVVIVGVSVLALDGARYVSLQTQLQQGADALALAGAAELNGSPTAITRACNAITTPWVSNVARFGSGADQNVQAPSACPGPATCPSSGSCIRFLSSLPASDSTSPIPSANATTDPVQAQYVEVTVQPASMDTILPAGFFGGANTVSTGAYAVAGRTTSLCTFTPLYICNPFETAAMTYDQATQALKDASLQNASQQSRLIKLDFCQNGPFVPGCFGYITPVGGSLSAGTCGSQQPEAQSMGQNVPNVCARLNNIDFKPGVTQPVLDALNVRFDLFTGSFGNCKTDSSGMYPPDENVRKGFTPQVRGNGTLNYCNPTADTPWPSGGSQAKGYPLDTTMTQNIGNGIWDCASYWSVAHPSALNHTAPAGCTATATISRYSVYKYEIAQGFMSDRSSGKEVGGGAGNYCSTTPAAAGRRLLHAAYLNCLHSPVPLSSNAASVPVATYGQFFLTLPAPTNTDRPYGEFVGLEPVKTTVQLYR
jgi:hypothetical protein